MIIQKCELQEGVLPGLKASRNLVVSGLRDPKETFISVAKLAFICPGFGSTLEEIWVHQRVWQLQELLQTQTLVRDLWLQGERDHFKLFPLDL